MMVTELDQKKILIVAEELKNMVNRVAGINQSEMDLERELISFGLDSLLLMTLAKQIDFNYKLQIPLDVFFSTLNTLYLLAKYIVRNGAVEELEQQLVEYGQDSSPDTSDQMPKVQLPEEMLLSDSASHFGKKPGNIDKIVKVFVSQYDVMSKQNEIIRSMSGISPKKNNVTSITKPKGLPKVDKPLDYFLPYRKLEFKQENSIDQLQLKYIKNIENKLNLLTKNSKKQTQKFRNVYASNRNSAGFRLLYKEMLYQIIVDQGKGSKIIDIDGNEMIDLTMGFGVLMFGHSPDFVKRALIQEIKKGMPIGPMGRLSGQVASAISELTGVERVFFCNSGTEANMFAVRVARAVTRKNKIVCFNGSFHGTYDGVLGIPIPSDNPDENTISLVPGITDYAVKDLILLDYDSDETLQYIDAHADVIAAVLTEPVQSRRPDLQPTQFLKKLRKLTQECNITLIFDEIITGFRIGAGGAQEYFGIEADIVTYGKVIGGGMPIGILAGKSTYLDSIDGGMWSYGNDSTPPCEDKRTFVAGTFCHHPLAMTSARNVLQHIKKNKDTIYVDLNQKTEDMVAELNGFFKKETISIHIDHFGSLFRFTVNLEKEIFYYGLLEKGIYIWEGRNCFLSTEHSSEDIRYIIDSVKKTIYEMKEAGFF